MGLVPSHTRFMCVKKKMRKFLPLFLLAWLTEGSPLSTTRTDAGEKEISNFTESLYSSNRREENITILIPKMDYEDWTPLGRGDPLKNDPTYDYVPPVLERVHYWIDPDKRTPDPPLLDSGLLVLEPKTKAPLFPALTSSHYITRKWKEADSRLGASTLADPFYKFIETPQHEVNANMSNIHKPFRYVVQRPKHQRDHLSQVLQRPPHTILMPPPLPSTSVRPFVADFTPSKAIKNNRNRTTAEVQLLTVAPTTTIRDTTMLANTENVFRAVAISMPGQVKINENTASTHKTTNPTFSSTPSFFSTNEKTTKKKEYTMRGSSTYLPATETAFSSSKSSEERESEHEVLLIEGTTVKGPLQKESIVAGPKTSYFLIIEGHSKVKTYGASKNPINRFITSNTIIDKVSFKSEK